jgi:hypothetical protein
MKNVFYFLILIVFIISSCNKEEGERINNVKIKKDNDTMNIVKINKIDTINSIFEVIIKAEGYLSRTNDTIIIKLQKVNDTLFCFDSIKRKVLIDPTENLKQLDDYIKCKDKKIRITGICVKGMPNNPKDVYYFVVWDINYEFYSLLIAIDDNMDLCGYAFGGLYPEKDKFECLFYQGEINKLLYGIFIKVTNGRYEY